MFLAVVDILRPIAGVSLLVVQQTADAKLFNRRTIPTGPEPCARSLVSEDSVQPVAVLCLDGVVWKERVSPIFWVW